MLKPIVPTTAGTARIDNIDMDQLLRNIGEASASSSAVDLFGLLLGAQRVLAQVQAGAVGAAVPGETELVSSYRAMTDDARGDMICVLRSIAKSFPRHLPALTLVPIGRRKLNYRELELCRVGSST